MLYSFTSYKMSTKPYYADFCSDNHNIKCHSYTHTGGSLALTEGRKEPGEPSWYLLNVGEV